MDNSVMTGSNIPKYEDLFSTDLDKVEVIGKILLKRFHKLVIPHCIVRCLIRLVLLHDL